MPTSDPLITVVVPLGRPEFLQPVVAMFAAQTYQRKRLVVVESSAEAWGACKRQGVRPDAVLRSKPSPAAARNQGLAWTKDHGGGPWAGFDDDDEYLPEYLSHVAANLHRGDVVGKSTIFVRTAGGTLRLFEHEGEDREVQTVHGPTLAGWSEDAVEFPAIKRAEDWAWVRTMRNHGARVWATSRHHFAYCRRAAHNHLFQVTDWQHVQRSKCRVWDVLPDELGVIAGRREPASLGLVPLRPERPWDSPRRVRNMRAGRVRTVLDRTGWAPTSPLERIAMLINTCPEFQTVDGAAAALRIEMALRSTPPQGSPQLAPSDQTLLESVEL